MKNVIYQILVVAAFGLMMSALWLVFGFAPADANMGIVQKIFYFHVPAAYITYLSWTICAFCSIAYLVKRAEKWDTLAKSAAELALVFAGIVMISGPVWAKKAWGAYWTWDPRLTTTLLLALIIVSYTLLRSLAEGEVERRFAAALSILGTCVLPVIHFSVQKWRGQHPTVITSNGGGLSPDMKLTFAVCMIAYTALFAVLLIRRYGLERDRRRIKALRNEAIVKGLFEEAGP
jgi:heme exporter protein C